MWKTYLNVSLQQVSQSLRRLRTGENFNSKFSVPYASMTITFDTLDRFKENKVLQTAKTMNNVQIRSSEKMSLPLIIQDLFI